jgi:hypothetical protein
MRTMKTKTTMAAGALGAVLLLAAGCGGSSGPSGGGPVVHVLDSNDPIDVPAGTCAAVAGPFSIPGGASTTYSIADDNDDNMDIAVIDASANDCSPITSDTAYTTGAGPGSGQGTIPVTSTYILAISCLNLVETCIPTVDSWTYTF